MTRETATATIETPLGPFSVRCNANALTGTRIARAPSGKPLWLRQGSVSHPILSLALDQLEDWFSGRITAFDLPLTPAESGDGERLRAGIASVAYGETLTYGALAERVGSVARAIGQACKTNAFPIIIPCHRIISTSGPEFYSGGAGPRTKTWLLDFEYNHLPDSQRTRLL